MNSKNSYKMLFILFILTIIFLLITSKQFTDNSESYIVTYEVNIGKATLEFGHSKTIRDKSEVEKWISTLNKNKPIHDNLELLEKNSTCAIKITKNDLIYYSYNVWYDKGQIYLRSYPDLKLYKMELSEFKALIN